MHPPRDPHPPLQPDHRKPRRPAPVTHRRVADLLIPGLAGLFDLSQDRQAEQADDDTDGDEL